MKTRTRFAISLLLALSMLMANLVTAQAIELRYTGITRIHSDLTISAKGVASCEGKVALRSGYTADLTVELKQDGVTIETWTKAGSGIITAGGTRFVSSGHDYILVTTATVYDKDGKIIETPSKDSVKVSY